MNLPELRHHWDRRVYFLAQFVFMFFWLHYCFHLLQQWRGLRHDLRMDAIDLPLFFLWLWVLLLREKSSGFSLIFTACAFWTASSLSLKLF